MNESELTAPQLFALFGIGCIAGAITSGLILKKLTARFKKDDFVYISDPNVLPFHKSYK